MREHKTLLKLLDKAYYNGEANQNGRQIEYDFGRRYIDKLESKFYAKITDDGVLELQHWGTTILTMTETKIEYAYAESKSDVDLIMPIRKSRDFSYGMDRPTMIEYL